MKKLEFDYSDMKETFVEAILLVCLGISIGLMFNYNLVKSAFEGKVVTAAVESQTPAEALPVPVSLDDVQEMMARALLIDARIPELYEEGHLPGSMSLPLAEIDARLDSFLNEYPERSLIIYCSGYGCSDSFDLAILLMRKGYRDVMVYEGGYPEWRDAGLPITKGAE